MLSTILLLALAFTESNAELHAFHDAKRHHALAKRVPGDVLEKRETFTNARFTFYDAGLGACGITNTASDFIVALNSDQYGSGYPGPNCFKSITIQVGSKTATATITDECPGCPWGGLDFTRGLFDHFADESVGVLTGSWWFNDGSDSGGGSGDSGDSDTTTTKHTTKHSTTTTYTPTTTSTTSTTTHHTTSSSTTTTSTTSKTSSSSKSSSSVASSTFSTLTTDSGAAATGVAQSVAGSGDVIENLYQGFIGMTEMITDAGGSV